MMKIWENWVKKIIKTYVFVSFGMNEKTLAIYLIKTQVQTYKVIQMLFNAELVLLILNHIT